MFETAVADGVLQLRRPETRWLATGPGGGFRRADAAYNVTVPEGWSRTDLDADAAERRDRAGFAADGPTLLTGVAMEHAAGARVDPVVAYATAGLSNPAALPVPTATGDQPDGGEGATGDGGDQPSREATGDGEGHPDEATDDGASAGTVNVVVGTTAVLDDGAMATLLGVAVEAKAATLQSLTGFPGTTTDAVVVGSDPAGESEPFAGSATTVGAAARACVRDAVGASLHSRYPDWSVPDSVAGADHGVVTDRRADLLDP